MAKCGGAATKSISALLSSENKKLLAKVVFLFVFLNLYHEMYSLIWKGMARKSLGPQAPTK